MAGPWIRRATLVVGFAIAAAGCASPQVLVPPESLIAVPTQAPPAVDGTPGPCPAALLNGQLVSDTRWGVALRDTSGGIHKVIWPFGYVARMSGVQVELIDGKGSVVARERDLIQIGGGATGPDSAWLACGGTTVVGGG